MRTSVLKHFITILFLFFSLFTALKILFVGYDIDEQYAVAMAYRLLKGDFPLLTMWEPHQTSAFLCALLMLPWLAVTKSTTGIILWLRLAGLLLHSATALGLYRFLSRNSQRGKTASLLICCLYFFSLPKLMFLPEFSNMQIWFLMLMILCLLRYFKPGRGTRGLSWIILAGVCMTLEVLAYPSAILIFPVCLFLLWRYRKQAGHSPALLLFAFSAPCVSGAALFLSLLLSKMSFSQLLSLLPLAASDGSHSASLAQRLTGHLGSLGIVLFYLLIYSAAAGLSLLLSKSHYNFPRGKKQASPFTGLSFGAYLLMACFIGQLLIWLFGNSYPNYPLVEYFFLPGILAFFLLRKKVSGSYELSFFVLLPLTGFLGILLFSNHPFLVSAPFLIPCIIGILALPELSQPKTAKAARPVLILWVIVLLFGKNYMVRTTGGLHYTVFDDLSLIRSGPAAGIICDTKTACRCRDTCALVSQTIPEEASVFYAGVSNDIYLMKEMNICTPSTISSPTFDEKTMEYFSRNPEKWPEYVVCDANLSENDIWLADFLAEYCEALPMAENDFIQIFMISEAQGA